MRRSKSGCAGIRASVQLFESNLLRVLRSPSRKCSQNKTERLWKYMRQRSTGGIPQNVFYKDTTPVSSIDSANLFSSFYECIFLSMNLSSLPEYDLNIPTVSFAVEDVHIKLQNIETIKGPGFDNLQPCCSSLALPTTLFFNRSSSKAVFPNSWKMAKITPNSWSQRRT